MKITLSAIQKIIDTDLPANEIARILTMSGIEVDACDPVALNFEKVVVGHVKKVEPHPEADKLRVALVTDGTDDYQVVCGAPNCREGIKTAFATIGAVIKTEDGQSFKIKKSKLRGVASFGMLCSENELGIGKEDDGIIEFSSQVKVGQDIAQMYADTVFEISLTPNLNFAASVLGVARELATQTEKEVKMPKLDVAEDSTLEVDKLISLQIEDQDKCQRYACAIVEGVKVEPSPDWLVTYLKNVGLRSVNNVVDITNYVLHEMGHPLHAFDLNSIAGKKVIVRSASDGEKIMTLDEKKRFLTKDDLIIADEKGPLAIAGVMGGKDSEVVDETTTILIESAYFEPVTVRKTAKRQGLSTDSSKRFERGADPNGVITALKRACHLVQNIAGGRISKILDQKVSDFQPRQITCRLSKIQALLGIHLSLSEVQAIFKRLFFTSEWDGSDTLTVTVPTYRVDILEEIDLIEEVARVWGYVNFPKTTPKFIASKDPHAEIFIFENQIKNILLQQGLQEFLTCDLIGPTLLSYLPKSNMDELESVKVMNPTSIEQSVLRTSLLPGLMQACKFNYDHQSQQIAAFEVGRIHFKSDEQFKEQSVAAVMLSGQRQKTHWSEKSESVDFYDLKGILENIFSSLKIENVRFEKSSHPHFHPGRQAAIFADQLQLGILGQVHPAILRKLDLAQELYFAEFNLHDLYQSPKKEQKMLSLPLYPGSSRDLTLTLDQKLPVQEVFDIINSLKSRILESVACVDVWRHEKIGQDKQNVTFHFVYRDRKKTVAQQTVDAEHARIEKELMRRLRRE